MADNYLERRMEEHRADQAGASNAVLSAAARRRLAEETARRKAEEGILGFFGDMSVMILALKCDEYVTAAVRLLRQLGLRVAFTCNDTDDDHKTATKLAQASGARFYPGSMSGERIFKDLSEHWNGPDAVVAMGPNCCEIVSDARVINVSPNVYTRLSAPTLARCIAVMLHPELGPALQMLAGQE